ncbi:MAG: hypothetical protein APR62_05590 [Smithella sp. SDB]|nr:MAG: hypothetical protein APR62_05590 [Smithella sp. SDB]
MMVRHKKIAMAIWNDIISPVFDSTYHVLIVEIKDGKVISSHCEVLGPELPYSRALRLSEWGIQVLICGGISIEFVRTMEIYGIEIIPFITGSVRGVLNAYLNNTLMSDGFFMPGFKGGRRRNRFRGGRR